MERVHQRGSLEELRMRIAGIGRGGAASRPARPPLSFGIPEIDTRLPAGGLASGALHEVASAGPDRTLDAVAHLHRRDAGAHPWTGLSILRAHLFAPSSAVDRSHPDRAHLRRDGRARTVLLAMEEGLRHQGLGGVVGEIEGRVTLTASRRLQLAAGNSGTIAFALRQSHPADQADLAEPIAAETRWRITAIPSQPPLAWALDTPGLGRARWRLDLIRCRGGEPHTWIVEAPNAQGHLGLASDLANRSAAQAGERDRAAG